MRNPLQKVLDFAMASSREAEAFFKAWAPEVDGPETQALFAEWAATERGRTEMLSRIVPEEMIVRGREAPSAPELADLLVDIKAASKPPLEEAIRLAIQRKGVTATLYDRVARLEGEACFFFRSMANEDRRAIRELEAYARRIAADV
jgi:rubrerythrin